MWLWFYIVVAKELPENDVTYVEAIDGALDKFAKIVRV
jgi:hypothetical protein